MLAPHRKNNKAAYKPPVRTSLDTGEEEAKESEESMVVLPSSTELFYFYGQSLEQCASLSTAQPLFDLANVHKKWLRIYAGWFLLVIYGSGLTHDAPMQRRFWLSVRNGLWLRPRASRLKLGSMLSCSSRPVS